MTRLILTLHAKSTWDRPELDDFDRPLNGRGQRDAPRVGAWLREAGYAPGEALVSSAVRTWQTFARLYRDGPAPRARFLDALYHAGPEAMLATLHGAREDCVMMVGHNPGIADFATRLLAETPADPDYARYPTCATAVIDFPAADWGEVAWKTGTLVDFTIPKRID